nr:acylneuraminate cytidylyltransferase family protein [Providencia rettgeri]
MINNKKVMAIIPARGGSKRLPRKNILPLAGKPLITWSIDAARNSKYVDNIFISTDDQDIADICTEYGLTVHELRPPHLASDESSTDSVLSYTLEKYGKGIDIVILLQPTSPLRTSEHIDEALELFIKKDAFSIVSVTTCEHSPLWANTLPFDHNLKNFISNDALKRSQDLSQFYRLNGAIYIFNVKKLLEHKKIIYTPESYAYIMEQIHSVDIDKEIDFLYADFLVKNIIQQKRD